MDEESGRTDGTIWGLLHLVGLLVPIIILFCCRGFLLRSKIQEGVWTLSGPFAPAAIILLVTVIVLSLTGEFGASYLLALTVNLVCPLAIIAIFCCTKWDVPRGVG
jgi:hypothetical protein